MKESSKYINRVVGGKLVELAGQYPVVTITGPRQSGKTTLSRMVFPGYDYANLEYPDVRQFALEDPRGFLAQFTKGVILDEIQRVPDLLSYIQGLVDESGQTGQFILTGSQHFVMMKSVTQSLAGRTALVNLLPFSLEETQDLCNSENLNDLIFRGFYPRICVRTLNPTQAYADYVSTYVERDLRQLSSVHNLQLFEKFLRLCAGRCGQLLNIKNLADDAGIAHTTAAAWLDLLETSFIIYRLRPYYANFGKRLIKSPKLYFTDVGLASYLLGIESADHLKQHPLRGNLFENLVVMEVLKHRFNRVLGDNLFFYRDSNHCEVDLLYEVANKLMPIEIKAGQTVSSDYFKGLLSFYRTVNDHECNGVVIYAGAEGQKRSQGMVIPLKELNDLLNAEFGAM